MDNSIATINIALQKALVINSHRVNDDKLKPAVALARRLNNYKSH